MLFAFLLMLQALGDPARDARVAGPSAPFGPAPVLVIRRPAAVPAVLRPIARPIVRCAARILELPPKLDAGVLAPAPRPSVDPRIIGRVSPCLQ